MSYPIISGDRDRRSSGGEIPEMVDFTRRAVVPDQVVVRQLDDELVILDLTSESYFGLDEVGTVMWNELTAATSLEQAYTNLLGLYDVSPEELRLDFEAMIEKLIDNHLLTLDIE